MTTLREAAQQALEALTPWADSDHTVQHAAYHALRTALAQEQAEPWEHRVAEAERAQLAQEQAKPVWIQPDHLQKARVAPFLCRVEPTQRFPDFVALYTTPPQRKPLTEEEIYQIYSEPSSDAEMIAFARAIERAHGIGGQE